MTPAHSQSVPEASATLRVCRLCKFTGRTVSPGLVQLRSGKVVAVDRCTDHLSCLARREEARRK